MGNNRSTGRLALTSHEGYIMSAYCLFDNLEVSDLAKLEEYKNRVAPVVRQYGGRYVVLGGEVDLVEGAWKPTYPVMIEFPSLEQARRWYDSDEYRALKGLRLSAGRFNAVFMEGL
jgi:uncharacterized protein (DUF1330 family)